MSTQIAPSGNGFHRILIIDDEEDQAEATGFSVEDAGLEPVFVEYGRPFASHAELDAYIEHLNVHGIICDHRLTPHNFSTFNGASYVAHKNIEGLPSLLTTHYIDIDADVSIREFRRNVPVILRRETATSQNLLSGFMLTKEELAGNIGPSRKPHRTLVRITGRSSESGEEVVDAIIPQWNPYTAVRFPMKLISSELGDESEGINPGDRLLAMVNIGAHKYDELYFYDFRLMNEVNPEDGLA